MDFLVENALRKSIPVLQLVVPPGNSKIKIQGEDIHLIVAWLLRKEHSSQFGKKS